MAGVISGHMITVLSLCGKLLNYLPKWLFYAQGLQILSILTNTIFTLVFSLFASEET